MNSRSLKMGIALAILNTVVLPARAGIDLDALEEAEAQRVRAVPAWSGYQGNASHTGYVPLRLNPADFKYMWDWTTPNISYNSYFWGDHINPVTVSGGKIALSDAGYFSPQSLYVLDERTGHVLWQHDFPSDTPALNPPTIQRGRIAVATSGHERTFMHMFDAESGSLLWKTPFQAQWEHYMAPTIYGGVVYTDGGYYGGMYGFRQKDGVQLWFADTLPQVDMFTPAVDADSAYAYANDGLYVVDRKTGELTAKITDPNANNGCCLSYSRAPILTSRRRAISHGQSADYSENRPLISFDLAARTTEWRTDQNYTTQPALAHGHVYAGSASPLRLAAIDETNAKVSWWWTPNDDSIGFCRNVIATDTHVFISTDKAVHAIDLATRESVWSYPVPGELALSATGTLLINEGCKSTGRIIAIRLMPQQ